MEVKEVIIAMLGTGIISSVGEKVLISFGKSDMATFTNIAGLSGIALLGMNLVVKLVSALAGM